MTAGAIAGWVLAAIPPLLLIIGVVAVVRARAVTAANSQPVKVTCPMPAEIKPMTESAPEPTPPVRDEWDTMMDKIIARMRDGLRP